MISRECYLFRAGFVAFAPTTILHLCFQQKVDSFTNSGTVFVSLSDSRQSSKSKPCTVRKTHAPVSVPNHRRFSC
ncbi:hypothetical protein HanPI659440_Chr13g0515071 [Helianthus annuus]|nr:hypothetical protein HanPI659440_Chr13g0515071 [Helianthus annuus]